MTILSPLSCDLQGDPLACAILRQWARQPWQEAHRAALCDYLEETGRTEQETAWVRRVPDVWGRVARNCLDRRTRTGRRVWLRWWVKLLLHEFGDFETTPLCDGTVDTPQGG